MYEVITRELVDEFLEKLRRQGHSKDYIDGALEGLSFTIGVVRSYAVISQNKERYKREEYAERS